MPINYDLLKSLCETPGVSGHEDAMRALVTRELEPLTDTLAVDTLGSIIATKHGSGGPRIMLAAHMDEIGFLVKFIDDRGFLRLHPVGGWDARTMVAQRVHVQGYAGETLLGTLMPAAKPIHQLTPEERSKPAKMEEFFVDVGLPGPRVKELVEIGDPVTMARTTERIGDSIVSKSLDDRLCLFVMIEALRLVGPHQAEIIAVATVQEEVGVRGALTAAQALKPDVGVALDVTLANDFPGPAEHEYVSKLGDGPAINIMDSMSISNPKMVKHLRRVADQNSIKYQLDMLAGGGTDAAAIQKVHAGVPVVTLSLPTRYIHTVNEMANVADIEATITLLARYLEDAHTGQYV